MLLKEVFTPGGQPSVTYVGREHLQLEKKVKEALIRGYSINVVTGPTKSGKTVLCRKVLSELGESISIEGGQIRAEEDFWGQLAHALDIGKTRVRKEVGESSSEAGLNLAVHASGFASAGASGKGGQKKIHERSISYDVSLQPAIYENMLERKISLLVDDFHYIPKEVQKSIIQSLKGAVFDGLSVILLAVPHRAFDPMTVEQEVEGRFKHIEIPAWDVSDLIEIPVRGFDALKVISSDKLNKIICDEGFGNPLLVQDICSEFCIKNEIYNTAEDFFHVDESLLNEALMETAQSKGFPKYSKLKSGPDAKKKRMLRELKDGRRLDKYAAILAAVAAAGPKAETTYDEIRQALSGLLIQSSMPAKHEITAALVNMSKIARDKIDGEPVIEWVSGSDTLVITDPFLLHYMKWAGI